MAAKRFMRVEKITPHLRHLREEKEMSTMTISAVSGVPRWAIDDALSGRVERLNITYAKALLKVKDGPKRYLRSPLEAQRQLRALAVKGYAMRWLSAQPGMPDCSELCHIRHGVAKGKVKVGITVPVLDAINRFYQDHKDIQGPSTLAAGRALAKGWKGPEYWEGKDMSAPEEEQVDAVTQ